MPVMEDPRVHPLPPEPRIPPPLRPVQRPVKGGWITVFSVSNPSDALLKLLQEEFNGEVERGDSYPMVEPMSLHEFRLYWFSTFTAVAFKGQLTAMPANPELVLGTFYIKPNYPGRCNHVCNAGFITRYTARGMGFGRAMGEAYLVYAKTLGYRYSVFNLVFETNTASLRIWDGLGFERIGRVKGAGNLKGHGYVDAVMIGKDLTL